MAAARPLPENWVQLLVDQIEPDIFFTSAKTTARGTLLISWSDASHGVALGRIAQHQVLNDELIVLLRRFALARRGIEGYREVLRGLAAHQSQDGTNLAFHLHSRLLFTRSDAKQRSLEVGVGVERVLIESVDRQASTLRSLRTLWEDETEPEIRLALAQMIGRASIESNSFDLE